MAIKLLAISVPKNYAAMADQLVVFPATWRASTALLYWPFRFTDHSTNISWGRESFSCCRIIRDKTSFTVKWQICKCTELSSLLLHKKLDFVI